MPRGRRSQNASQAGADDDEPLSQSQSQTQRRSQAQLPEAEVARAASRLVRYVLAAHGRGEPLRRDKLRRQAVAPPHAGCLPQLLREADRQLRDVFGMSLEVLSNKRDLLLVSRLPVSAEPPALPSDAELQRRGLLVVVLALILMSNDAVHEETLWRFLEKLGVHRDQTHVCFGSARKLVTEEFKRAGYLATEEVRTKDGVSLIFHWGEAAELAVDSAQLLEFVCNVWGDAIRPEDWPDQHQRALQLQQKQRERLLTQAQL